MEYIFDLKKLMLLSFQVHLFFGVNEIVLKRVVSLYHEELLRTP